jgi:SAM-dependent methyltransferase
MDGRLIARSSRILEPLIFEMVDSVIPDVGEFRMLEVGCGSGIYIRRACLRNPDLKAVGLEIQPDVADFARQNLESWGIGQRVRVDTGDIRNYECIEPFDLVTLHNNIYYFPLSERLDLLRRLAGFLKPGGKLLLTTGCQGSQATLVLNLWGVMTEGSGPLPVAGELFQLIEQAGFVSTQQYSLMPGQSFYAFVGTRS